MAVTREFVLSIVECIQCTRMLASDTEKGPQFKEENGVGRILRARVESMRQSSDLLTGWVKRNAAEGGCNPAEFDI